MKKILFLVLLLLMPSVMFAQERVVSKNLPEFKKVELSGKMNVKFVRSTQNSFNLKLKGITSDKLDWGIKNDKLYINLRSSSKNATADIVINFVEIDKLVAMLSTVEFEDNVKFRMLDIELKSGAELKLNGTIGDLMLSASGNSNANISGVCDYFSVSSVLSIVRAGNLETISTSVKAATGAEVIVNADERLEIDATKFSTVFYMGNPMYLRIKNTLNSKKNIIPLNQK